MCVWLYMHMCVCMRICMQESMHACIQTHLVTCTSNYIIYARYTWELIVPFLNDTIKSTDFTETKIQSSDSKLRRRPRQVPCLW